VEQQGEIEKSSTCDHYQKVESQEVHIKDQNYTDANFSQKYRFFQIKAVKATKPGDFGDPPQTGPFKLFYAWPPD